MKKTWRSPLSPSEKGLGVPDPRIAGAYRDRLWAHRTKPRFVHCELTLHPGTGQELKKKCLIFSSALGKISFRGSDWDLRYGKDPLLKEEGHHRPLTADPE